MNLSKNIKITVVLAAVAADTSSQDSSVLDMQNYDGVMFIALTGDVLTTAVLTLTAKGNTANSVSSPTPTRPAATRWPRCGWRWPSPVRTRARSATSPRPSCTAVRSAGTRTGPRACRSGCARARSRGPRWTAAGRYA